jgi:hypothetical protein
MTHAFPQFNLPPVYRRARKISTFQLRLLFLGDNHPSALKSARTFHHPDHQRYRDVPLKTERLTGVECKSTTSTETNATPPFSSIHNGPYMNSTVVWQAAAIDRSATGAAKLLRSANGYILKSWGPARFPTR